MLWIACTALVAITAWFVLRPLFREPLGALDMELPAETEVDRLLSRKAAVYSNLKDLEFEYKMGRLSDSDFRQLQAGYKNEAAGILQNLDQLNASENLDDAIEKDIALRKSRLHGSEARRAKDISRCPSCGAKIIPGKNFCADCGTRL
jgi:ribosomal protein L32